MGTNFKKAVVPPRVNRVLHVWHKDARKRLKTGSPIFPSDRSEKSRKLRIKEIDNLDLHYKSSSSCGSGSLSSPMSVILEEGSLEDR